MLHPCNGLRSSPIAGVVVTGGDVDALAGLLHLRERHRFTIYAPRPVLEVIAANPIVGVLAPEYVGHVELRLDNSLYLVGVSGDSGLAVRAFGVPGEVPLYLEENGCDPGLSEAGDAVGLELVDTVGGPAFSLFPAVLW